MCRATEGFQTRYHMSENAYHQLVDILHDDIAPNEEKSRNSTGGNSPISAQMVTCMGIRYMGGEKTKSLADAYRCHIKSVDRVVNNFLDAVDFSEEAILSTDLLPKTESQKAKLADEWNACSGGFGVMRGHLAPIDGWLCTTQKPSDVLNPSDYRSGHYQKYGLNVQAMCDTNLRIIF